jgi:hypothetical protein
MHGAVCTASVLATSQGQSTRAHVWVDTLARPVPVLSPFLVLSRASTTAITPRFTRSVTANRYSRKVTVKVLSCTTAWYIHDGELGPKRR